MQSFHFLDKFLIEWDERNADRTSLKITADGRACAHYQLFEKILAKLVDIQLSRVNNVCHELQKLREQRWKDFCEKVTQIQDTQSYARSVIWDLKKMMRSKYVQTMTQSIDTYLYNASYDLEGRTLTRAAFNEAFGIGTTADIAFHFIENQISLIKDAFNKKFDILVKTLETDNHATFGNKTLEQFVFAEMNDNIIGISNAINNYKSKIDRSKPTIGSFKEYLAKETKLSFDRVWDDEDASVTEVELFVDLIKKEIDKLWTFGTDEFKQLFTSICEKQRQYVESSRLGCCKCCPMCGAKCMLPYGHPDNCRTDFHFLQAFVGKREHYSHKLVMDICCSRSNMGSYWARVKDETIIEDDVSWDKLIKETHPEWYPIERENFEIQNVIKQLTVFFDHGLQDKILSKYRDTKCVTRADVCCKDELDGWP